MLRAAAGVVTGEVTIASRDVSLDGVDVRKGAWLGLAGGAAVASDESFDVVAAAVVEHLLADGREILTLLTGEDEPALDALLGELGAAPSPISRSRCTSAVNPTTRCCSRRSEHGRAGVARRGQRGLPVDARVAARRP